MDYKEKYEQSLARAKEQLDGTKVFDYDNEQVAHDIRTTVYNIFPELKESGDERIKKNLIEMFHDTVSNDEIFSDYGLDKTEVLAWLEKQGEQKSSWTEDEEKNLNVCLDYIPDELLKEWLKDIVHIKYYKSADKIEPKFKIRDWIVYNRNDHSREVMRIYDIRDNRYYFNDNIHFSWSVKECDEKSHLWTIEDAKEGDVLVASDDSVFIFARVDGCACIYHIALANDGVLKINPRLIFAWENVRGVKPATKEQHDKLEKAMLKDGYKWDANKKEPIKL